MKLATYRGDLVEVLDDGRVFILVEGCQIEAVHGELHYAHERGEKQQ